jgi:hypothetical protein
LLSLQQIDKRTDFRAAIVWIISVRSLPPLETLLGLSDHAPVLKTTRRIS